MGKLTGKELEEALEVSFDPTPLKKRQPYINTKISVSWWLSVMSAPAAGKRAALAILYTASVVPHARNLTVSQKAYVMCGLTRKAFTKGLWYLEQAKLISVNREGRAIVSVNLINYK